MFDSGVRGASDVFKALALGAKFVFVGRLWVWGLSIMGETGVRHVMTSLLADLDILMNVAGFQNISQIDRTTLGKLNRRHCVDALINLQQNPDRRAILSFQSRRNSKQ
jgi:isopentenyl diphosphate isomerase/L-lactate dehydrogenase-like FMN-dependent dehydrogenase